MEGDLGIRWLDISFCDQIAVKGREREGGGERDYYYYLTKTMSDKKYLLSLWDLLNERAWQQG